MEPDEEDERLANELVEETLSDLGRTLPEAARQALRALLLAELLTDPDYRRRLREVRALPVERSGTVDRSRPTESTAKPRKDGTG